MFYHPESQTKFPFGAAFNITTVGGEVRQYPSNWLDLSTPEEQMEVGLYKLLQVPVPTYDPDTEFLTTGDIYQESGVWYEGWKVFPLSKEAIEANYKSRKQKRIQEIDEEIKSIELDQLRPSREILLAQIQGLEPPAFSVSKFQSLEAKTQLLRDERKTLCL